MRTYAILVTNVWTRKRTLMPGTYDEPMARKTVKELKGKVSYTGSIPNNSYEIVEIVEHSVNETIERGAGDDYPVIEHQNWK